MRAFTSDDAQSSSVVSIDTPAIHDPPNHGQPSIQKSNQSATVMLRGWVNYFAVGHSSECFSFIKDWVEKKVRRHMGRARNRKGFGWKRWSRQWLYESLRLFNGYKGRWSMPKVAPTR